MLAYQNRTQTNLLLHLSEFFPVEVRCPQHFREGSLWHGWHCGLCCQSFVPFCFDWILLLSSTQPNPLNISCGITKPCFSPQIQGKISKQTTTNFFFYCWQTKAGTHQWSKTGMGYFWGPRSIPAWNSLALISPNGRKINSSAFLNS